MSAARDRVDPILDQLEAMRPEGDQAAKAVHIRLRRISHHLETETRRRLAPERLEFWELPLLSGLIRAGGSLSVGVLQDMAQVSSGAITQRVAKLEDQGCVRRVLDARDRRQVNVEITAGGVERFERLRDAMEEIEAELFGDVAPATLAALADLLRDLLIATEGPDPAEHR